MIKFVCFLIWCYNMIHFFFELGLKFFELTKWIDLFYVRFFSNWTCLVLQFPMKSTKKAFFGS